MNEEGECNNPDQSDRLSMFRRMRRSLDDEKCMIIASLTKYEKEIIAVYIIHVVKEVLQSWG